MDISYDYYRIFYYVAKCKNFTQAAELLLNNQPNITRSIKNLEAALGCTLFIRTNRGVSLTPEGEKLYDHIAIAFEQIRAGEEEVSLDRSLQRGIISIGSSETALHSLLFQVLKNFRKTYPGIRLKISNYSTSQAIAALKNGTVDLAVVTGPTCAKRPLQEIRLKTIQEIPVCGPSFVELKDRLLHLYELIRYPLICLARETITYEFYNHFFLEHGLSLTPDMEVATADQILPMVKNDLGIGFLPDTFAEEAIRKQEIYPLRLAEKIPERFICLVKHSGHTLNIAARELEKMLLFPD